MVERLSAGPSEVNVSGLWFTQRQPQELAPLLHNRPYLLLLPELP